MNSQKEAFLQSEGNQWFQRTKELRDKLRNEGDEIVTILQAIDCQPQKVLEIGCSRGDRLNAMNKVFGAECYGIDPSKVAIEIGKSDYSNITTQIGTADDLPFDDNCFDTIIFGFCLYLCDRSDLFKIAYEADRCLQNKGTLIIKDFYPPFPYKNTYPHLEGVHAYKMDHSKMFGWHPAYEEVFNIVSTDSGIALKDQPNLKIAITVLRKNTQFAYPLEPFSAES